MKLEYHALALDDLSETLQYYDSINESLGDKFKMKYEAALTNIKRFPEICPAIAPGIRKYSLSSYPYSIYYLLKPQGIKILAIMHDARMPGSWRDRI